LNDADNWYVYIESVPKMLEQATRANAPHTQRKKNYYSNICPQTTSFVGTAQHRAELSLLDFYLWDHLKANG